MTEPNVYWTLETPFVNIIGLYSNVPEGGEIRQEQFDWFVNAIILDLSKKLHPTMLYTHQYPSMIHLCFSTLAVLYRR